MKLYARGAKALTGLPVDYIGALAVKGAATAERGAKDFTSWSKEMEDQYGDAVKDHLPTIWNEMVRRQQNPSETGEKPRPVPGEEGKNFRSLPDTEREGQRAAGVDPTVERQQYDVRGRDPDRAAARKLIDEAGPEAARKLSLDPNSQIHPAVQGAVYVELANDADKAIKDARTPEDLQKAIRSRQALSDSEAPLATSLGQRISMYAELNKNTRAGVTKKYLDQTRQEQDRQIGDAGVGALGAGIKSVNALSVAAVRKALTEMPTGAFSALKLTKTLWQKYRADASQQMVDMVQASAEVPKERAPLQDFTQRIVQEMQGRIRDQLPEAEKRTPVSAVDAISEAVKNKEKYKEVFDTVRTQFVKEYGEGSPPVDLIDQKLADMGVRPYSNRLLDKSIRDAHVAIGTSIRKVATEHWSNADRVNRNLSDALVDQMKLSPDDANRISQDLESRMTSLTADAKTNAINQLIKRAQTGKSRRVLNQMQRLVKMNNLGALNRSDAMDVIAPGLGLTKTDPAQLQRLGDMADRVETAPTVAEKARAAVDLANEMRDAQKLGRWSRGINTATSFLYANILASKTLAVKGSADVLNSFGRMASTAAVNPMNAGELAMGWLNGLGMGMANAKSVLKSGRGGAGFDLEQGGYANGAGVPEQLSNLEGTDFPQKIVPRVYKAVESLFYYPAREAYARLVATKILQGEYKGQELRRVVRDKLGTSPALFEQFKKQATDEGFKGDDVGLRIGSLIEKHRASNPLETSGDPSVQQQAEGFADKTLLRQQPTGLAGIAYRAMSEVVQKTRVAGVPILKPFALFMKVPTNLVNMSAEWSPVGLARAKFGMLDETGKRIAAMTDDERNQLYFRGVAGSMMMGGLTAAIVSKANNGIVQVSGNGPKDAGKRAQLQQTGWIPHAIKVGNGPWMTYTTSPLMLPLAFIGNLSDNMKYNDKTDELLQSQVLDAAAAAGMTIFDLPVLQGMARLMDMLRGHESAAAVSRFMTQNALTGVIPGYTGLKDIDQAFDPVDRNAPAGTGGTIRQQIPFDRRSGSPHLGPTGEPTTYSPTQRFMSSERPGMAKDLTDMGVFIPKLGRTNIDGKPMSDQDTQQYQAMVGKEVHDDIQDALPDLKTMSKADAQKEIDKIHARAVRNAKAMMEPDALQGALR